MNECHDRLLDKHLICLDSLFALKSCEKIVVKLSQLSSACKISKNKVILAFLYKTSFDRSFKIVDEVVGKVVRECCGLEEGHGAFTAKKGGQRLANSIFCPQTAPLWPDFFCQHRAATARPIKCFISLSPLFDHCCCQFN